MKQYKQVIHAVLDYKIDWSEWLTSHDDDTIDTSTWEISPSGELTVEATEANTTETVIWLSGGTLGTRYTITNHIVTNSTPIAREKDKSFKVKIIDGD